MDIFSGKQILIPIVALVLLAVFNLIADPSFYKITLDVNSAGNHVLSGYLITILDYGSELAILAIGMTLVTAASGGQDISVGAGIAIAGSVILRVLCGTNSRPDHLQAPIIVAFLVSCVVAMLFGAFNGILVAGFKIQPMVATLILYTAGRSIAAWINNNELPVISDPSFGYFGGFIPGIPIPTPFFIAVACMIVMGLVMKFTSLGLYTQAVGINESSSRLNGLNPAFIKFLSFVILGLCVNFHCFEGNPCDRSRNGLREQTGQLRQCLCGDRCDCGAFSSHSDVCHAPLDEDGPQFLCCGRQQPECTDAGHQC